jgi:SAM-dependent methyltransferase
VSESDAGSEPRVGHWDSLYEARTADSLSWYQAVPQVSLELIQALGISNDAAVIDIGGGTSFLADRLVEAGFSDVTVLDISASALEAGRRRLPGDAPVHRLRQDLLAWRPARRYDLWHDRAVFHFLVVDEDRARYLQALSSAVRPGGAVVLATFARDAPERCSGLPVARYSTNDLIAALGNAFECLETRREEHTTPRGLLQPFTWIAGRLGEG